MPSSTIAIGVFSNPMIGGGYSGETNLLAETLRGIHTVARQQGVQVVVISETPSAAGFPPPAWEYVDGWIAIHVTDGAAELAHTGVPLVLVNDILEGMDCLAVLPDNRGGAHAASDDQAGDEAGDDEHQRQGETSKHMIVMIS